MIRLSVSESVRDVNVIGTVIAQAKPHVTEHKTEINTFFITNSRDIYSKLSRFSESSVKVKVWPHWTFLIFSLQLFARTDFWK